MAAHGLGADTLIVASPTPAAAQFAAHLWWMLRWISHERVACSPTGWQAWAAAGPARRRRGRRKRSRRGSPASRRGGMLVGAGGRDRRAGQYRQVKPSRCWTPARAARYRVETEPHRHRWPARIPGALNRPARRQPGVPRPASSPPRNCAPSSSRAGQGRARRRGAPVPKPGITAMPQPARHGDRRPAGLRLLPGLVERMRCPTPRGRWPRS